MISMILFYGGGRLMGNTTQVAPTKFSSPRTFVKWKSVLSGRPELSPNVASLHGPCCIIEFWLRTTSESGDGLAIQFVAYATYHRKLWPIYVKTARFLPRRGAGSFLGPICPSYVAFSSPGSLYDWWKRLRSRCCKESKKIFDGLLICFWWNIWLERNNGIFQGQQRSTVEVAQLVKDQVENLF
jgi:hypothetical protein